jgi:hypothetical protein
MIIQKPDTVIQPLRDTWQAGYPAFLFDGYLTSKIYGKNWYPVHPYQLPIF